MINPHGPLNSTVVQDALYDINIIRQRHRCNVLLSMPSGIPRLATDCPVAIALRDCSPTQYVEAHYDILQIHPLPKFHTPMSVSAFMSAFDRLNYPEET